MESLKRNLVGTNFREKKTACLAVSDLLINYHLLIVNDSEPTATNVKSGYLPVIRLRSRILKVLNRAVKV